MHRAIDAFLAYNEREKAIVEPIAQWLTNHKVQTHFFARDKQYGEPIDDTENLDEAATVIAFLGSEGWGKNHLRLVERALKMKKSVFPVLIGDTSPSDREMAQGLFVKFQWIDLRIGELEPLEKLLPLILDVSDQYDPDINTEIGVLISGHDNRRQVALDRLMERAKSKRALISAKLREELARHGTSVSASSSSGKPSSDSSAAARSWLRVALIHCDPESPQTREIALRDIMPDAEPAEFARFWSLAAARRASASYLPALAEKAAVDQTTSVSFAGVAMLNPGSPKVLNLFKAAFRNGNHWTIRGVLRALRIVHVPEVIGDVCALAAGQNRAEVPMYDVFCALATPEAATLAAALLAATPGIDAVVDRVIEAAYDANYSVARDFSMFLATLDATRSRDILNERSRNPQVRTLAQRLLEGMDSVPGTAEEPYHLPGFAADTIDEQSDQLGIQAEVQTLAAIIMARDVTPPLAIGLFGEWGSGKSFFMSQMRKTVNMLAQRPPQQIASPYCSEVVQITFNAWHYAETNLWASLVSAIFEKLAFHVFGGTPTELQQAQLIAELASAKAVTDEVRAEERRASEQLEDEEARLDVLRKERLAEEQKLAKFTPTYLIDLLDDSALKKKAEQAFEQLGLPVVLDRVDDFKHAVAEASKLSSQTVALLKVLSAKGRSPLYVVLFVAAVAVPAAGYAVYDWLPSDNKLFTAIGTVFAGVVTFATTVIEIVRRGMKEVNVILAPVMEARKKADAALERIRTEPADAELELAANVEVLKVKEQDARRRVADAAARVAATEERLRELKESRDLARFISDRHDSADYRKHLGLVSLVRQDFEALSERIREHGTAAEGGRKVERIVLYIDDLDRCPASQVVNVLQAVHLLLAYPLFVVVVGVDSRWLTNSLTMHYKELGAAFTEAPEAASSPQHYLEKIFQIPYSLRPMSAEGYGKLVGELTAGDKRVPVTQLVAAAAPSPGPAVVQSSIRASAAIGSALTPDATVTAQQSPLAPEPAAVEERALIIHGWEQSFAASLFPLIPSPRAAKRLVNVYRVLKAGIGGAQLQAFEGTETAPGQFQIPLLLLAIQICDASAAAAWFADLIAEQGQRNSPEQAFRRTATEPSRERLMERIQHIVTEASFPKESGLLTYWIPRVRSFTFETRSIV
ncbi:P-loop NTPase fold protein [Pseudomonas viridiflava]|uniref:P-loop NTPase fold protein n=1 Tax=Pseudomonas viridiflava TaxID=33069 RepID=UPI000F054FB1|nr:P-loop NTPase fold protein [Pseudomonas viridiflava]